METEKKGLTKEKLRELYIDKEMGAKGIQDLYEINPFYFYKLLGIYNIPKRDKAKNLQIYWNKTRRKKREESKTFIHRKIDEIKKTVDITQLNHRKARQLVSCEPGTDQIIKLCEIYGYNSQILINTYRKLEGIWDKLNLYPSLWVNIALSLFLRYDLKQKIVCKICKITPETFRFYYKILQKHIKLTKERRSDPFTL